MNPFSVPPGAVGHFSIAQSQSVGLSVPLLEARKRVSTKYRSIHLNGVSYALSDGYVAMLEAWEARSWLSQALDSDGGTLIYRSPDHVLMTHGRDRWELAEWITADASFE